MRKKKGIGNGIILWIIGIYLLFPLFLTFLYSLFTFLIAIIDKHIIIRICGPISKIYVEFLLVNNNSPIVNPLDSNDSFVAIESF